MAGIQPDAKVDTGMNPSFEAAGVPSDRIARLKEAYDTYFPYLISSSANGWESWTNDNGVIAHRQIQGEHSLVRAESLVPGSITDVLNVILESSNFVSASLRTSPGLVVSEKIKAFSSFCFVKKIFFEKVNLFILFALHHHRSSPF